MDPSSMFKVMSAVNTFKGNHPKFFNFVETVIKPGIPVDTVVEITIQSPVKKV